MTNDKAQMPNQAQNPNEKKKWFWHLSIWISIVIGILTFGFVWSNDTLLLSLRGTLPSCLCEECSDEAISMAAMQIAAHLSGARNDKENEVLAMTKGK